MYHKNEKIVRNLIVDRLANWGVIVDEENGGFSYDDANKKKLKCQSLYILRHAETLGTRERKFMSDYSNNTVLTEKGIKDTEIEAIKIENARFDCILYSSIPRVKQTAEIVKKYEKSCKNFVELSWISGIDNAGWEGMTIEELKGDDWEDFYQREVCQNIFARSAKGCSWGEVFVRCTDLIEFINEYYANKKILLIAQESIFRGIRVILHQEVLENDYNVERFFGLKSSETQNYGKLRYAVGEVLI